MTADVNWKSRSAAQLGGSGSTLAETAKDQSVEALIRRLIARVEESERRYSEALDDLHARLDQLSQTSESLPTTGSSEETETLERLRSHLSSLTERLEPKASDPGFNELAKLDKALAEARQAAAGLHPSLSPYVPPSFAAIEQPPVATKPAPPSKAGGDAADLDTRLVEMASRLERSIVETNAKTAVETLNTRMDDLAKRFEAALAQAPGTAGLKLLEQQVTDIGQQVGRVEQQMQRFSLVESELNRLIQRFEGTPAQMMEAASRAANEAARLVAGNGAGSLSAIERLDAIHRDLVAMNERSRATDDRVVDTLAAVHESLKGLVHQLERGNRPPLPPMPRAAAPSPDGMARPGFSLPPQRPGLPPFAPQSLGGRAALRDGGDDAQAQSRSARNRLRETLNELEEQETAASFGRSKRAPFDEDVVDADEIAAPSARPFETAGERDSIDDLVAAARRASQAAAARAEQRTAPSPRQARLGKETASPIGIEAPERRKRSLLIIAAALLLLISAGLLYGRLRMKLEPEVVPPAAEQTLPAPTPSAVPMPQAAPAPQAPALETAPAPQAAPVEAPPAPVTAEPPVTTDVVPDVETTPTPEAVPVPNTTPDVPPHATAPSGAPAGEATPPEKISGSPTVIGGNDSVGGITEITKSAFAHETQLKPQPVSLRSDEVGALPPGMAIAGSPTAAAAQLPLPGEDIGPLSLREAAAGSDPNAQYIVGLHYAQGVTKDGTPNWSEAARWFALAASAGLAPAQYRLAVLYERGDGVAKDLGTAKSWYMRAAEQGNVKAMHNLAVAVSRESSNADYALAAKWYEQAASYGLADSQFNLGVLAEHGLGMKKDLSNAYVWFSLAAATRDADAIKRRDSLKAALSIVGAAEADAAIRAWKAKPAKPEANQVAELDAWRMVPATANKDLVIRAQQLLNKLGYDAGTADGNAGARTRDAVKDFELRNGMDQTGEITGILVNKLEQFAG